MYIDKDQIKRYYNLDEKGYKNFISDRIDEKENLFKNIYAGFILGKVSFIKEKLEDLKEQTENLEISYRKRIQYYEDYDLIIRRVAEQYKKDPEKIINIKNKENQVRKITIYIKKNNWRNKSRDRRKVWN